MLGEESTTSFQSPSSVQFIFSFSALYIHPSPIAMYAVMVVYGSDRCCSYEVYFQNSAFSRWTKWGIRFANLETPSSEFSNFRVFNRKHDPLEYDEHTYKNPPHRRSFVQCHLMIYLGSTSLVIVIYTMDRFRPSLLPFSA